MKHLDMTVKDALSLRQEKGYTVIPMSYVYSEKSKLLVQSYESEAIEIRLLPTCRAHWCIYPKALVDELVVLREQERKELSEQLFQAMRGYVTAKVLASRLHICVSQLTTLRYTNMTVREHVHKIPYKGNQLAVFEDTPEAMAVYTEAVENLKKSSIPSKTEVSAYLPAAREASTSCKRDTSPLCIPVDSKMALVFNTALQDYAEMCSLLSQHTLEENNHQLYQWHHIIPRFYFKLQGVPVDESSENLVRIPLITHFLVHFYAYKCCLPEYRLKFLSAVCILGASVESSAIRTKIDISCIQKYMGNCVADYKDAGHPDVVKRTASSLIQQRLKQLGLAQSTFLHSASCISPKEFEAILSAGEYSFDSLLVVCYSLNISPGLLFTN